MKIACFDMEGTLTPEIWEQVALDTGIEGFNKTTRDIPDYGELMDFRLDLMASNNLGISDVQNAVNKLDLLDGAKVFLDEIKESFQVVILSDTFHEFASPLMRKMGYPLLLCHNLDIDQDGSIKGYKLRHTKAKRQAIEAFQSIGYECLAAGDSYNDIQMFDVADHAFFMNAPEKIAMEFPKIPSFNKYDDLKKAFLEVA